jgi:hypothetical protein
MLSRAGIAVLISELDERQKQLLRMPGAGWTLSGAIGAVWWGASCVAKEGGRLARDTAWCAELGLFGFVCWSLLGLILGFPLFYWLVQQNRTQR